MIDELVEAAKNEWFNPTKPLRDETEGERFVRIVKQAITAALQSAPVGVSSGGIEGVPYEAIVERLRGMAGMDFVGETSHLGASAIEALLNAVSECRTLTAALAVQPGSVDWRKVLLDDKPTEEMRHYAHTAYAASGDLMDACRAFVRAAPLTPSAIRAEGLVLVRKELLDDFPEINPNNYNDDDVRALNQWGINLVHAAAPTPSTTA